ncbi:chaperone NapD [Microvirga terricola]|uniref:Chaperone NapD n=1 Tax=Microvirga terricola TaxID=2719797 RepID=A0ABX0V9G5_9HYPH|nr:chaperone NapD [Microvirga terricola]NIX75926.1 chaperone NapD [Microvirga terricola]
MRDAEFCEMVHISSAVVTVLPDRCADIVRQIAALANTEVHHAEGTKIIVVMEAPNSDVVGRRLTDIALIEGVLSANLVFEQIDTLENQGEAV